MIFKFCSVDIIQAQNCEGLELIRVFAAGYDHVTFEVTKSLNNKKTLHVHIDKVPIYKQIIITDRNMESDVDKVFKAVEIDLFYAYISQMTEIVRLELYTYKPDIIRI